MNHPVADPKSGQIQVETETLLQIEIQSESQTTVLNSATESPRKHAVPAHHHKIGVLPAFQSLLHLIVIAIFIITFCAQPFRIPS